MSLSREGNVQSTVSTPEHLANLFLQGSESPCCSPSQNHTVPRSFLSETPDVFSDFEEKCEPRQFYRFIYTQS